MAPHGTAGHCSALHSRTGGAESVEKRQPAGFEAPPEPALFLQKAAATCFSPSTGDSAGAGLCSYSGGVKDGLLIWGTLSIARRACSRALPRTARLPQGPKTGSNLC